MFKTRQTGFLCFASPGLCVPILRGKMCFFVVQFLFKLELNVFVSERNSGFRVQFPILLHLAGGPSQEGP